MTPGDVLETEVVSLICDLINSSASLDSYELSVFPNPTSDYINIEYSGTEKLYVEVLDIIGKRISYQQISNRQQINVSDIASDLFIVKVSDENQKLLGIVKVTKI